MRNGTGPDDEGATRKPIVAIVGRPNVGKSTLFNRLIGAKKAIVEDMPGVTRDRLYGECTWEGRTFTVVDTGGFDPQSDDFYLSLIREQTEVAMAEADVVVFVMDSTTGVMPQDREIAHILRRSAKPVLYVLNKVDHEKHEARAAEFYELGMERLHMVSAVQGRNVYELLDAISASLPPPSELVEGDDEAGAVRVALVGKPNVGKSTLVNTVLGERRLLVSPVPGTTRDSVDTAVQLEGRSYVLVDTAGVRRKSRITVPVERYSVLRTIRSVERADVCVLMIEAAEGPTHQDAHLAELIEKKGKASVVALNKWDLAPPEVAGRKDVGEIVRDRIRAVDYSRVVTISALTGEGLDALFGAIDAAYASYTSRIQTRRLNQFLKDAVSAVPPPLHDGKRIKFYYITQTATKPPTFQLFSNWDVKRKSYLRYLENRLRRTFPLEGTPVRIHVRARNA